MSRDIPNSWSELPPDLLYSVFDRLGFADFQRGKSVCSSWHSASRQCVPKNQIPWLILFPEDDNTNNSCMLFNLEEKDKLYKTQDFGLAFARSFCIATYDSWLLMRDPLYNLYIVNLFTHERIDLPSVESQLGTTKIIRSSDDEFCISKHINHMEKSKGINIRSPVFWVDEKTKDYVVIWGLARFSVVYAKQGDTSWIPIPVISACYSMVYKDHKLYFSSRKNVFRIFDLFGDAPQETFQCPLRLYISQAVALSHDPKDRYCSVLTKFVVTVMGDVLGVDKRSWYASGLLTFHVYKVYSSGVFKKDEKVDSLGDEAMLYDLGITVPANDIEGLKGNTIYFNGPFKRATDIYLFNLETQKVETLHKLDQSSICFSGARWFLPSFKTKCF